MCHKCATGPLLRGGSGSSRGRAQAADLRKHCLRHQARTDDLRIQNEQTACPLAMWHKMCHSLVIRDGSGSFAAVCRPLTCTNTSGPRRARTDDLRIKSPLHLLTRGTDIERTCPLNCNDTTHGCPSLRVDSRSVADRLRTSHVRWPRLV